MWPNIGLSWKITKIRTTSVLVSYPKQLKHSPERGFCVYSLHLSMCSPLIFLPFFLFVLLSKRWSRYEQNLILLITYTFVSLLTIHERVNYILYTYIVQRLECILGTSLNHFAMLSPFLVLFFVCFNSQESRFWMITNAAVFMIFWTIWRDFDIIFIKFSNLHIV